MDLLFEFELPEELIAQEPATPRDHARLLVYDRKSQKITDDYFYNLAKYLNPETLVVANNSKVSHCRYLFNEGKMEIFAVESLNNTTVRALVRPGKKFKLGAEIRLVDDLSARVSNVDENGLRTIVFNKNLDSPELIAASHVPLPPYIAQNDELAGEYQTIYAKQEGSLAAPTAGLHFTTDLKAHIEKQFGWSEVTLEVGLGTFAPIKDENFKSGTLHSERYIVEPEVFSDIKKANHVTAVGTTTLRTLESIYKTGCLSGTTDIFITPGFGFQRVDSLITNFHLPSTSLLLLVEAFIGSRIELEKLYKHAIKNKYRFYSFGDAMLIL